MRRLGIALVLAAFALPANAQETRGAGETGAAEYDGRDASAWTSDLTSEDVAARRRAAYALWNLAEAADAAAGPLARAVADDDAYVRTTCAKAVLRLGESARRAAVTDVAALLGAERAEVRREAATLLWRLGAFSADAVPQLTAALDSEDAVVRANAAGALANAGDAALPAIERLLHLAGRDRDDTARRWAGRAAASLDPVRALRADHRAARLTAVETWASPAHRGWERDDVCAELRRMVLDQDEDERVRTAAGHALDTYCAFLRDARPVEWIALFRRVLEEDRAPAVRAQGAYGLGRFKGHGPDVLPPLIRAAQGKEPGVRRAAVIALGWLGETARSATPSFLEALVADDASLRAAAALALGGAGDRSPEVIEALVRALGDTERPVRHHAVMALGAVGQGSDRAEAALVTTFGDSARSAAERGYAAEALAAMGAGERGVAALSARFDGADDPHPAVAYALAVLQPERASEAVARLAARLRDGGAPFRELDLLRRLGPTAASATRSLIPLVSADDLSVRLSAIGVLEAIGPAASDARSALESAADDPDTEVAAAARRALAALSPDRSDR